MLAAVENLRCLRSGPGSAAPDERRGGRDDPSFLFLGSAFAVVFAVVFDGCVRGPRSAIVFNESASGGEHAQSHTRVIARTAILAGVWA
jgi:hypothetical protein